MFWWAGLRDSFEEFGNIAANFPLRLMGHPLSYITFHTPTDVRYSEIYILGDLNYNILSNLKEVHSTHFIDYQLAQLIKELTNRKLVLIYLLHIYTPWGDPHLKVKGMLIVSLSDVNCRFWYHLKLFSTLYLPVKVSLRAVHK